MEKLKVKKSKISGNGIFTGKIFKKNEQICFLEWEYCNLDEMLRRVNKGLEEPSDPLGIGEEEYIDLNEISRTFNHSCSPTPLLEERTN